MRCNALRHAIRRGLTRGWITSMLLALALGFTPGPDLSAHDDDRAEIRGHVADAVTGKPIEGANVFAVRDKSNSSLQRKTDGKGKYEFKHLEPGPWVIEVGKPGYAPQRAEVVLQPDKRLELDFALQPNMDDVGEIAGAVIDNETGEPVPDAFVFVRDPLKDGPHDVIGDSTDEHGRYSIPGLPAGRYEVHAVHPDYERAKKTVEVHAGLLSVLNFDLTPRQEPGTGSLLVRVADADTGLPVAEAIVTIEGIFTFAPLLTDENGELAFDSLAAGERRVQVDKQGYEHQQQIARIEAGRQTLLEFELVPLSGSRLGAIAGRVINGANEAPIEHARVYYRLIEHDDDDDDKSHDASPDGPFVETGPDGVYEIPDLRPGLYGLQVVAEGFYSQWNKAEVKPGETTRVPFALRPIVPAEAGFLAGQVTDAATSEPVVGARVFFARQDEVDKTMMLDATDESRPHVVTDENGNYETPPLRPGQYLLVVRARGYEPARRMAEVRSGETTEVNFALVPFVRVEPGSITGLVLDGLTSQPIAGALIFFAPVVPDAPDGSVAPHDDLADHLPSVRTDNTGRYQIDDLRPGRYRLIARARGYLPATARAEVQSGQSTRVNFALRPDPNPDAGVIQGRVIDRESNLPLAGAFVFFARLPINTVEPPATLNEFGAMMSIEPPAGGDDYVRTNGRGRYQTPRLRPGVYVVIAWAPGFASQHVIVPLPAGGAAEANFALQPLEPMHPGVIEGRVIDRLTGDPVAGAWVFYHPAVDDKAIAPHDAPDAAHPHVRTNARGEFRISPLRPGRYHLAVRADGFEPAHKNVNVEAGEVTAVRFLLEPKRPPHPGAIVGQVVDGETGDPVAGARVFFGRPLDDDDTVEWWRKHDAATDHLNFVETDDQGFYRIKPLRPGAWHLLVRAAGYQPAARKVVVRPGQTVEANFKLRPNDPRDPGSIVGRVTDGTNQTPLEGARVYYRPVPRDTVELDERSPDSRFHPAVIVDSERPPFVETDANGRFKIEHLRPGRYQLLAVATGYLPASEIVAVEQGHTTEASFALRPRPAGQGDLAGIVVDAQTHDPLRGAHVWVIPAGNVVIAEAMIPAVILGEAITDNTGRYRIEDLPAGPVIVFAAREGYRTARKRVEIPAGGEAVARFALQPIPTGPTGHLAGTVLDARTEQPLEGVLVALIPARPTDFSLSRTPDSPIFRVTDENGQFAFRNLPVGHYRVRATREDYLPAVQLAEVLEGEVTRLEFLLELQPLQLHGALAGVVTDAATSAPIEGAWVRLAGDEHAWLSNTERLVTRTNAIGEYQFEHVPVGVYKVLVVKRGYEPGEGEAAILADQTTELNFALTPVEHAGAVEGVVTDAVTGAPIAQAIVFIPIVAEPLSANEDNTLWAQTDEDGRYRIEDVPAGQRTAVCFAGGYFPDAQIVTVVMDATTTLDFALVPWPPEGERNVRIRVHDRDGKRLAGVRIHVVLNDWIQPGSSWDAHWSFTNADGVATIHGVPAGNWSIVATLEGYEPRLTPLTPVDETDTPAGSDQLVELQFDLQNSNNAAGNWQAYP